jgi:hypothetical protein
MARMAATTLVKPHALCSQTSKALHAAAPFGSDHDGWQEVESQKALWRRLKAARRRRPVSVDHAGRCFNCFHMTHIAARCRQWTRCFHCRELGHRSFACPSSFPSKVWRPVGRGSPLVKHNLQSSSSIAYKAVQGKVWRPKKLVPTLEAGVPPPTSRPGHPFLRGWQRQLERRGQALGLGWSTVRSEDGSRGRQGFLRAIVWMVCQRLDHKRIVIMLHHQPRLATSSRYLMFWTDRCR